MDVFELATQMVREYHAIHIFHTPGGYGWACECGVTKQPGFGYPTEKQASAKGNLHLRAAHRKALLNPQCPTCKEWLGDYSDYEGVNGYTASWWADKSLYEHLDEQHT